MPLPEHPIVAILAALFLWWFSTGAILWRVRAADNAGEAAHLRSVVYGLPFLVLGVLGFRASAADPGAAGVWLAFASALAIWGWIELAFLSGVITGPNDRPCPPFAPGWERFLRAFGTIAFHELLLAVALVLMLAYTMEAENAFATLTFGVLFAARISAKLNLFFGVPRIHTEFLPRPLAHLPSHFRLARMNGFFPVSVTALTLATGCWIERAISAGDPASTLGFSLLAALTALALLEHWFMVVALPDERLWRWMLPAPKTNDRLRKDANGL
jgi:putative photosynthetic complex assembly protein 2